MCSTSFEHSTDPQKLIYIDTEWSLTHIVKIFKFGDVSAPRAKKWPKVNRWLKIVNYFTCMRHFFCRWYRPPEVDLNWYPRISNRYCQDIQIWKWPKVNRRLKIVNYFTCMQHFSCRWYGPPEVDLSGPKATKWPKVYRRLKIVNYFRCMCNKIFVQGCVK